MRALHLLVKDLRIALRDRGALALAFAFPLMLATIFGLVFGGHSPAASSPIQVVLVDADGSEASAGLLAALTGSGLAVVATLDDPAAATALAARGEVAAAILVPAGFGAAATGQAPGPVRVRVLRDPASDISFQVIGALVESYVARADAALAAGRAAVQASLEIAGPFALPGVQARLSEAAREVLARERSTILVQSAASAQAADASLLQLVVPGFVVMALLYTASNMSGKLLEERNLKTLGRLLVSPISRGEIALAKTLLTVVFAVIQLAVLMLVTYFAWGIEWGPALPATMVAVGAAIGVAGFGSLLTALVGSRESGAAVSTLVITVMSVLGGSFFPVERFPEFMQVVSKFTVNHWAIRSFRSLAEGDVAAGFANLGPVLLLGLAGLVAGATVLARRDGAT